MGKFLVKHTNRNTYYILYYIYCITEVTKHILCIFFLIWQNKLWVKYLHLLGWSAFSATRPIYCIYSIYIKPGEELNTF